MEVVVTTITGSDNQRSWPVAGLIFGLLAAFEAPMDITAAATPMPGDTVVFLEDAYQRGVLRQGGAVYQFRHIRLQRHLAQSYRHRHIDRTPDDADSRW